MNLYYTLTEGRLPIPCADVLAWAMWFEQNHQARRVAHDACDGYRVSTVFLGLDHNFRGCGDPLLFETMVFLDSGETGDMDRYTTWAEAAAGHERIRSICARQWADARELTLATLRNALKRPEPKGDNMSRNAREGRFLGRWQGKAVRTRAPRSAGFPVATAAAQLVLRMRVGRRRALKAQQTLMEAANAEQ
jgi:hypothetical protein